MPNALVKRLGALPSRDDSADMVVRKLDRMSAVKRAVKDWSQQMEAGICAWIEDHGDLEIPGVVAVADDGDPLVPQGFKGRFTGGSR